MTNTMINLIETLSAAARAHAAALLSETRPETAACTACGRAVNAARSKLGGRHRFCSDRCMDAYDAGWPVYGTAIADYATKTAHRKPVAIPMTKDKRKPRKRILQPRIAA
jgi:endogenous inhibitor of DNA gyrase (YacG/DUF329 family)